MGTRRVLAKTVMMTDPVTHRGVTLLAGTVPTEEQAKAIGNPAVWAVEDESVPETGAGRGRRRATVEPPAAIGEPADPGAGE